MTHYNSNIRNKRYNQDYTHDTLYPGATFKTKSNGEYSVLGRSEDKTRRGYYVIEFKVSGVVKEAYGSHIKSGSVSDAPFPSSEREQQNLLMKPKYFGIGYIGKGKHPMLKNGQSHQRTRSFILWHNMLARCYTINSRGKPFFSAYKGVVVCERWHNFQNFCDDMPSLHGYAQWKNNPGEYELDKDYSHRRIYSPDTVAFISTSENAREARLRNSAMKIQHENYRKISNSRSRMLKEAEDELKRNEIMYEVVLHGNTKLIISDTPYGTAAFWPLTNKILRHGYITNGDVFVYLRYLNWLRLQWQSRNPHIDYIAATS